MRLSKRLAACNALLDVAGFRAVDEDAYGRPVLRKYREPQDRPVSMTLREDAGARFINEVVDELDRSGVANVVHCDYETQDAFYRGTAIDSDPEQPILHGFARLAQDGHVQLQRPARGVYRCREAEERRCQGQRDAANTAERYP